MALCDIPIYAKDIKKAIAKKQEDESPHVFKGMGRIYKYHQKCGKYKNGNRRYKYVAKFQLTHTFFANKYIRHLFEYTRFPDILENARVWGYYSVKGRNSKEFDEKLPIYKKRFSKDIQRMLSDAKKKGFTDILKLERSTSIHAYHLSWSGNIADEKGTCAESEWFRSWDDDEICDYCLKEKDFSVDLEISLENEPAKLWMVKRLMPPTGSKLWSSEALDETLNKNKVSRKKVNEEIHESSESGCDCEYDKSQCDNDEDNECE